MLKGLPLAYNRDLQEDKEPLFDAVATLLTMLPALTGALRTIRFDTESMARAAGDPTLLATDLAEYLGTVLALNLLFGVPLLYASIFGALDVIILLAMIGKRFRVIEQYFAVLISILVLGILYNLVVVKPDLTQIAYHSIVPSASSKAALLIVVGMIGATVMPHAVFVHSWLSKNKMDLIGRRINGGTLGISITDSMKPASHHPYSHAEIERTNRFHLRETILALIIASVVNAGILLVGTPLGKRRLTQCPAGGGI